MIELLFLLVDFGSIIYDYKYGFTEVGCGLINMYNDDYSLYFFLQISAYKV